MTDSLNTERIELSSQLSFAKRTKLLIRKPREAFSLLSRQEMCNDALLFVALVILLRIPVVLQRHHLEGRLEIPFADILTVVVSGLLTAAVFTLILLFLYKLLAVIVLRRGISFKDIALLWGVSIAPNLLLATELPFLLLDFSNASTFFFLLGVRTAIVFLTLRTHYWGLRLLFKANKTEALLLTSAPVLTGVGLAMLTFNA